MLAFDPDGKNGRIVATGLRNCSGMTVQPATGALWCVVNERDALGDNVPFEYATSVKEGAFYGWPWYYIGNNEDPRHKGERPDLAGKATIPDVLMQAHSAPLNIAFYDGKDLPAELFRVRAMPSSPCTVRGTAATGPATRWSGCCSGMASRPANTRTS